jgi:hypothetical protein
MERCLLCGGKLKGKRKKFCCNKHKDRWHNIHNPRGIFAHLRYKDELDMDDIHDDEHPYSTDALGQN